MIWVSDCSVFHLRCKIACMKNAFFWINAVQIDACLFCGMMEIIIAVCVCQKATDIYYRW